MAEKIIAATLKVDTGNSVNDINAVNKSLDNTTKELGQTDESAKQSTGSFNTLKGALGQLPGPMKAVAGGVETVNTSLKALAANPIVLVITLLVAALYGLYKAFASTEAGAEKIEQVFSGLGAIVTVIRDRILALAGAVISFFKGDFKSAIEQTKAAVTGVGDAITEAYTKAAYATRLLQEAEDDLNRNISVNRALFERDMAKSKELISDTNATYKERITALNSVSEGQKKLAEEELANAQKTLNAKYLIAEQDSKNSKAQDEYAAAKKDFINIQTQQAADERALNKQRTQIDNDRIAKAKEAGDAQHQLSEQERKDAEALQKTFEDISKRRKELEKEYIVTHQQQLDDETAQRKEQADKDQKEEDDRLKKQQGVLSRQTTGLLTYFKTKKQLQDEDAAAEKKIDDYRLNNKKQLTQQIIGLAGQLSEMLGKNTIAGKAFGLAAATIDTFVAATAILKNTARNPITGALPGFAIAQMVATIVAGLATVKAIASVKIPGGDAGSGSVSAPSVPTSAAAPLAPQQTSTQIDQDSIQGIGDATHGRVYVLSQDVTHDQDRNERLNRAARLGN